MAVANAPGGFVQQAPQAVETNWSRWLEPLQGAIYESIEWLDRQGMAAIEAQDPGLFRDYLRSYGNTICGRHPLGVLLQVRGQQCPAF